MDRLAVRLVNTMLVDRSDGHDNCTGPCVVPAIMVLVRPGVRNVQRAIPCLGDSWHPSRHHGCIFARAASENLGSEIARNVMNLLLGTIMWLVVALFDLLGLLKI